MDEHSLHQKEFSLMDRLRRLCSETFQELTADILPFSIYFVVDREQGGFYGYVANDRTVHKEAPKALIQHSRMLWTFAHVERILSAPEYTPIALHARGLDALVLDAKHDGFFGWWTTRQLLQPTRSLWSSLLIYSLASVISPTLTSSVLSSDCSLPLLNTLP